LPIRDGEEALLHSIAKHMTYPLQQGAELNTTSNKSSILLQAHFDRRPLPTDLSLDQRTILKEVIRLVHAMTDVISTNGYLNATLQCMELS
jgi:pre-mRNA-splicing helicase BRR2